MPRSHETITRIAATPDAVWKAITDAEEITHWFSPYARVQPAPDGGMVGGNMSHSWDPEAPGDGMRIEIWEINQRLRVTDDRVAIDYFIESKDGVTTLRLVHSGFGDGAEWDGEYEGTKSGWPMFFRTLRFNLEQHPGEALRQVSITLTVDASPQEQWSRLLGAQVGDLDPGAPYTLKMPSGETLEGTIDQTDHRHLLAAIVENWNRAYFTVFCEKCQGKGMLSVNVTLYGAMVEQADEIEQRWRSGLERMFIAAQAQTS